MAVFAFWLSYVGGVNDGDSFVNYICCIYYELYVLLYLV